MMIVEADIPRLTAATQAGNVSYMTHQSPDLDLHSLVTQDKTPSFKILAGKAHRLWLSACDALLSDEEAISKIQVKVHPEGSYCIKVTPAYSVYTTSVLCHAGTAQVHNPCRSHLRAILYGECTHRLASERIYMLACRSSDQT